MLFPKLLKTMWNCLPVSLSIAAWAQMHFIWQMTCIYWTIPFLLPTWRMQTKMTTSAISTHSKADRFTRRGQMTTCGMPLMSVFTRLTLLSTTCFPLPMPPMQKNIACAPKRSTSVLSNTWHWSTSTPAIITKKRQQPIMAFLWSQRIL